MLGLITENVITEEGDLSPSSLWEQGTKYIELLASIGFNNHGAKKFNYLHQIICISSELLKDAKLTNHVIKNRKKRNQDDFMRERKKNFHKEINERILHLCTAFDANFNLILLADEFKYEVYEILSMNRYLKQRFHNELDHYKFDNKFKMQIALDFVNLGEIIDSLLEGFHSTIIRELETYISFPRCVSLKSFESIGNNPESLKVDDCKTKTNEYCIKLKNLPSGYDRSLLFNLELDLDSCAIRNQYKVAIANSLTKFVSDKDTSQLESQADLKLILNESNIESNITFNLNLEESNDSDFSFGGAIARKFGSDLNLSIVSKLSNVSDAYYIGRKIQLLVAEKLCSVVLEVEDFDISARDHAKATLSDLTHTIWEYANLCNSSNTNNMKDQNIEKWSESLIQRLEDIIDGYSLRNYQLSNMKCMFLFLDLE